MSRAVRNADITVFKLSRSGNKSSKKNKDAKEGTSSPNSLGSRDANQSPVLTPSSSSSTLNDSRNKPLPPSIGSHNDHANAVLGAQAQLGGAPQNPGAVPDRFSSMGGSPQGANGGSTPGRLGPLPPTVIISPSAPVGFSSEGGTPVGLILTSRLIARTPSWRCRNHAARSRASQGRLQVFDVR
jgi:hypothetical protein